MLTLGRTVGEKIILYTASGERLVIKVAAVVNMTYVRLSFDVPDDVLILREELDKDDND